MQKYIGFLMICLIVCYLLYVYKNSTNPIPTPVVPQPTRPTPAPTLSADQVKERMKDIVLNTPTPDPGFIARTTPTNYPLTEMAIKLTFNPSSTFKQGNIDKFNMLFNSLINENILSRMKDDGKKVSLPYTNISCYTLYTDTFLNPFLEDDKDRFQSEYDIIGAYMFLNLKYYVNDDNLYSSCKYYEDSHQLYLSKDVLTKVLEFTKRVDTDNAFFFINVMLPINLDDFVPRIGRYAYSNFANNYKTINEWVNMKASCM